MPQDLAVIGPENVGQLTKLARWGKGEILSLAYAPDGSQVAAATSQGVYFYETEEYKLVRFVPVTLSGALLAFSPSLHYLADAWENGVVVVWDLQSGQIYRQLQAGENEIEALAFTPDESRFYISDSDLQDSYNNRTYIWDWQRSQLLETHPYGARCFSFSADGRTLATYYNGQVTVWREGEIITSIQEGVQYAQYDTLSLSPDGELLALGNNIDYYMSIEVWRTADNSLRYTLAMESSNNKQTFSPAAKVRAKPVIRPAQMSGPGKYIVTGQAFSQDGQTLAGLNGFGMLHQWRMADGALLRITPTDSRQVIYSPDGAMLASWDYTAAFYRVQSGELVYVLGNHPGYISDLEFSPTGQALAVASHDSKIWLRSTRNGGIIRTFKTGEQQYASDPYSNNRLNDLDYSEDGTLIAAGTNDRSVYLWSTENGTAQVLERTCYGGIYTVSLSYDSRYLALQGRECNIEIVRLSDHFSKNLAGYSEPDIFIPVIFSPVAPMFATTYDQGAILYSIPDYKALKNLGSFRITGYLPMAFSDDGKLLAMGSYENGVEVWNVEDGSLVASLSDEDVRPKSTMFKMAFSPDNRLVAISKDFEIVFYDLSSGEQVGKVTAYGEGIDFSPDGRLLAVGGFDGGVYIFAVMP